MRAGPGGIRGVETLAYRVYACADFPVLSDLLQAFVDAEVHAPVKHCVLACAGQIMGNEVVNDNLPWPIHLTQLHQALGLDEVAVLNDFEALAYALDGSLAEGGRHLCGPDAHASGTTLVIGPGTGLGAAVHVPGPVGGLVLATEAGQMDFAPNAVREREVLATLAPEGGYVPFEHIVSGPGLLSLYVALCTLDGVAPTLAAPEAITTAALAHSDAQAVEAVEIFCASLGSLPAIWRWPSWPAAACIWPAASCRPSSSCSSAARSRNDSCTAAVRVRCCRKYRCGSPSTATMACMARPSGTSGVACRTPQLRGGLRQVVAHEPRRDGEHPLLPGHRMDGGNERGRRRACRFQLVIVAAAGEGQPCRLGRGGHRRWCRGAGAR